MRSLGGVGRCAVGVAVLGVWWKGRMAYAAGRELRGLVRVVSTRKNTEHHKAPRSGTFLLPTFLMVL